MALRLSDLFPFGDVAEDVLAAGARRFPGFPVAEMGAAIGLGRAMVSTLERLAAPLEEAGLSPARWRLMIALFLQSGEGGATIGELAGHLGIREPTVTATVDRAERDGLVERTRDARDGRVVRVTLTPRGLAQLFRLQPIVVARLVAMVERLGGPDRTHEITEALIAATDHAVEASTAPTE